MRMRFQCLSVGPRHFDTHRKAAPAMLVGECSCCETSYEVHMAFPNMKRSDMPDKQR
jgi:hypothetical protein